MDLNEERYNLICEQLKQCVLPEFDREIGDQPLEKADFHTFRYGLDLNLQILFDIITQHEQLLLMPFGDNETFRVQFILMIHQQSGDDCAPFQTENKSILNQINFLANKYYSNILSKSEIYVECLNYYKERLTATKWKKNIGAVYGYVQMHKLHQHFIKTKLDSDNTMFMLSVGMLLIDYFEPFYKQFALYLFNIIIDFGDSEFLVKMNIFEVIYTKIMSFVINVIKEEAATLLLLSCLLKCVTKIGNWRDPSVWNEVDDVLNEILRRLAYESDNKLIVILLTFISKLTTLPLNASSVLRNNVDFENVHKIPLLLNKPNEERTLMIEQLRLECSQYHNILISRWTKALTEVLLQLPVGKPEEIQLHLHVMHVCYLCCFYGNPLIHGPIWLEFLNKSIVSLLQLIKGHHNNQIFAQEVKEVLATFVAHLNKRSNVGEEHKNQIDTFRRSIEDLNTEIEALKLK